MGALSDCIGKAGKLLSPADAKLLMDHSQRLQGEGHPAGNAERMAVENHIGETTAMIDSVYEQAGVRRGEAYQKQQAESIAKDAADFWAKRKTAVPSRAGLPEEVPHPADNPELVAKESAAAAAVEKRPVVTPEDVAQSIPVPEGKSANQMMKMQSRLRAIENEIPNAKGADRVKLLEERLQVGAEMGHKESADALQKWHQDQEAPETVDDVIRRVVKSGSGSISTKGEFGNEVKMLREGVLPKGRLKGKGATVEGIAQSVKEETDKAGLTRPEDPMPSEGETIDAIKRAFSDKSQKEPPQVNVPIFKPSPKQNFEILGDRLTDLQFSKPGQAYAHTPLSLAWDGAIEVAKYALKGGEKAIDALEYAREYFKEKFPGATSEHLAKFDKEVGGLLKAHEEKAKPAEVAPVSAEAPKVTTEAAQPTPLTDKEGNPVTGISNRATEAQRAQAGMAPAEPRQGMTKTEMKSAAEQKLRDNPAAGPELVQKILTKGYQGTPEEGALLSEHVARVADARKAAQRGLDEALANGKEDSWIQKSSLDTAQNAYEEAMQAAEKAGTSWSDAGRARQIYLKEDYSIAEMERQWKRTQDGKPLSEGQKSEIKKLSEDYEAKLAEEQKARANAETAQRNAEIELSMRKMISEKAWEAKVKPSQNSVLKFVVDQGNAARARNLARIKSGALFANVDPAMMGDWAIDAAGRMAQGVGKLADLTEAMVKDFGEKIRPYMPDIFKKAQEYKPIIERQTPGSRDTHGERRSTIQGIKDRIGEGEDIGNLGHYVRKLQEQFVSEGIVDREKLIDALHRTLKEADPEITRTEVMDAMSGYGKFKPLNPHPIKAIVRDINGQIQQVRKLQDMQAGQAPSKTGVERRVPSDAERRLIKQVEEAKKKGGYEVTDPAKQLKTSQDAIKTRLTNQIKDLDFQIATGKKIVREKTAPQHTPEIQALIKQRDALKKTYDETFPKKQLTDAEKVALSIKAVDKSIADQKAKINEGYYQKRTQPKEKAPTSLELEARKAELEALNAHAQALRNLAKPEGKSERARELDAYAAQLATRYSRLMEQEARQLKGDFSKPEPRQPIELTPELNAAKAETDRARNRIQQREWKHELEQRPGWVKSMDLVAKITRENVLSWPTVILKLAGATVQQLAAHPFDEAQASWLKRAFPKAMEKAPIEGSGFSAKQMAQAYRDMVKKGPEDMWDTLRRSKNNQSEIDAQFAKNGMPREAAEYFGIGHGAEKAYLKRYAWSYAKQKLVQDAIEHGKDYTSEAAQKEMGKKAYDYAQRHIFQEENLVGKMMQGATIPLRQPIYKGGPLSVPGHVANTLIKVSMPVARVGANIFHQTFERIFGTIPGGARLIAAYKNGIEKLPEAEAEIMARQLKRGQTGVALALAAFLIPEVFKNFGGLYVRSQEKKKNPGDVKAGEIASPVHIPEPLSDTGDIPSLVLHGTATQAMQFFSTMGEIAKSHRTLKDTEEQGLPMGALAGVISLAEETPQVKAATNMITGMESGGGGTGKWAGNLAKTVLEPGIVQWTAQQIDRNWGGDWSKNKRDMSTLGNNLQAGIPFARNYLPLVQPKSSAPAAPRARQPKLKDYLEEAGRR